ncbi:MAG: DAK2 domain-containing protein [Oscillospiraceae bacterium]|nr:DAK2 domain-containing protein [Oscillospiraceae bacterium]
MVTGKILRDAVISGANCIINNKSRVDELNVFPVPDGDTGTNMSMTIGAAKKELENLGDDCTVAQVTQITANNMLRGARGNSGVISSLLFRGFSKALKDKTDATARDLVTALRKGVDAAYKAVMKPTEGTILTVARLAAEKAETTDTDDVAELWSAVVDAAQAALDDTPNQLEVLKKAGVVDAGGQGIVYIFTGMLSVFKDGVIVEEVKAEKEEFSRTGVYSKDLDKHDENIYKTEFVIKSTKDTSVEKIRAYLESIGVDVIVAEDESEGIVKCYVRTANPGKALTEGIKQGMLASIKITNTLVKVEELAKYGKSLEREAREKNSEKEFKYVAVDENIDYGFVAVASGAGIEQTFTELGADAIVTGGQTNNPSTEDILMAAQSVPAKTVFVLPNNKNIIMAAEQAAKLADRKIVVIPTRTIPQGITAMLNFDPARSVKDNSVTMDMAAQAVQTGSVTYAVRNADVDSHKVKRGDIMAFENSKLSFLEKNAEKAAIKLAKQMMGRDSSFITVFYGEDVSEQNANEVLEGVRKHAPKDAEVSLINGGQPVYFYLISVE